jgi:ubiquinone/menaquinone biosynthesis C-methylase UbiE
MSGPPIPVDRSLDPSPHPTGNDFNWLGKRQLGNALAMAAEKVACGRLIDIGCGEKPYQAMFASYINEHVGVDHADSPHTRAFVDVTATAYDIPLEDGSFDTALMSELLEHLETPGLALQEAHRLLRPGGWVILTSPFIWVLHEAPRDFYRYSPFGLRWLLEQAGFENIEVTPIAGQWTTLSLLASYALRQSLGDRTRYVARMVQNIGMRLERRQFRPWMSWNHIAVAQKVR